MNEYLEIFKKNFIGFFLISILIGSFWFLASSSIYEIKDNDSYFYIKIAHLYQEQGIFIKEFPWLYYTNWRDHFPGLHFLWSMILIPFVSIFGDLTGAKLLQSIVVGFIFGMIFLILKELRKNYHYLFVLLFFSLPLAPNFMARLMNARPIGFSILFFLLGLYFILKKKNIPLFITSFFFVWAYDGYVILLFLALLYFISDFIANKRLNWQILLIMISGFLWGNVINPYFPNNLLFSHFLYTNPVINLAFPISVEWQPPFFFNKIIFYDLILYIALIVVAASVFYAQRLSLKRKEPNKITNYYFIYFSAIFLIFITLLSNRFIDYLLPLMIFFIALYLDLIIPEGLIERLSKALVNIKVRLVVSACLIFVMSSSFIIIILGYGNSESFKNVGDFSLQRFYGSAKFLEQKSQDKDLVFLDRWDIFPYFFYLNSKNYYNLGLNGNFLLLYDPKLFFYYDNLIRYGIICDKYFSNCGKDFVSNGKIDNKLYNILQDNFKVKYFFSDSENLKNVQKYYNIDDLIKQSPKLKLIFEDQYFKSAKIYKVD